MKTFLRVALFVGLVSTPLLAHHGNAAFDVGKTLELKGSVTEWIWANPHCWLKFDVKDESGKTVNWVVEATNSADLMERGWSRLMFKPGDQVTVSLEPVKSGAHVGRVRSITLPNGKVVGTNYIPRP
jgi:Family of unknown function (DUF6152)